MKTEKGSAWLKSVKSSLVRTVGILLSTHCKDLPKYAQDIEVGIGGGAYCSVNEEAKKITIYLGLFEWLFEDSDAHDVYVKANDGREFEEENLYAVFMGLAMHEFGHAFLTRTGKHLHALAKKFPMQGTPSSVYEKEYYENRVVKYLHLIFNAICDARIENIVGQVFNVSQYFDFMRILDYMVATEPGSSKGWDFAYAILQQALFGKYPKFALDPEAIAAIESVMNVPIPGSVKTRNLIDEFVCEPNPQISIRRFVSLFDVPDFYEYVKKIIFEEIESHTKAAAALAKMLENMKAEVQIQGSGSQGSGNGGLSLQIPVKIKRRIAGQQSSEDEKENANGSSAKNTNPKDGEEKDGSSGSEGAGENDGEEKTESETGSSDQSSGEDGTTSDNDGADQNGSSKNEGDSNSDNASTANTKMKQKESSTTFKNGRWQLNKGDGSTPETDLDGDTSLKAALDAAISKIRSSVQVVKKMTKPKKPTSKNAKQASLKNDKVGNDKVTIDRSFKADKFAPAAIIKAAKPLKTVLANLMADYSGMKLNNRMSGLVNTNALYKKRFDLSIFSEKRIPQTTDAVYYIVWDGSGSMCGDKQHESAFACAVIEEAVRDIYPMKIINFSTCGGVRHYIVKEFDDKTKKSCAYSFGQNRYFGGGNKDGVSIRYCTEELLQRTETSKFLIVLSDGAPSDYNSHTEAVNDVKSAVDYARSKGIDVTSIFFGTEYERDSEIDLYKTMYGSGHIIACDPSNIVNHLIKIVKDNILIK